MAATGDTGRQRFCRRLSALLFLLSTTCAAQSIDPRDSQYLIDADDTLPPYVVPVLRLVSQTHVEPTTGLVISASGLVLVPMGFAAEGDEVIVLDGGTDIVRNGRPAHLQDYFPAEGLQVLSVPGLRRAPAPFADDALADGARIALTAFPPAERIAEGDPPLHAASTVVVFGTRADPAVSGDEPLPNVTGPLLDECGNVAAYSLAHDVQTMATHPGTRYQWRRTLLAVLGRLGVTPAPSACRAAEPVTAEEAAAPAAPQAEPPATEPKDTVEVTPADETGTSEPETATDAQEPPEEILDLERLPPIERDPEPVSGMDTPPSQPETVSRNPWPWLLGGLLLIAGGLWVHFRRRRPISAASGGDAPTPNGAGDSPDDADVEIMPAHMDRRLVLRGALADGTPLALDCAVSSRAINLVVGRGEAADLRIPSAAVSRRHVRLNGTETALTVTDLGSNNGTSVNGVPCLEGEILYLAPGDDLVLGDARLTVAFEAPDGAAP
jgi:hypothetical protein